MPEFFNQVDKCVDAIIDKVGKTIVFGMPLGLGKPNQLINAFYRRAKKDPRIKLTIVSALSLEKPTWKSELERRFLEPFSERVFGDFVEFEYMIDLRKNALPHNVIIKEFFCKPGSYVNVAHAQQNYISTNYTHAYRDVIEQGLNVVAQTIAKKTTNDQTYYSMSCNPDTALDILHYSKNQANQGQKMVSIGQVNNNLPFMYGDAVVRPEDYDMVIDNPEYDTQLFGTPKMAMSVQDYLIGFNASALVKDDGTLQIGIGSLGDAIVYGLKLRQEDNDLYKSVLADTNILRNSGDVIDKLGGIEKFDKGLLGSTEMLVDGYIELLKSGVVKRKTYNNVAIQSLINEGQITETVTPKTLDALLESGYISPHLTASQFSFLKEYGILHERLTYHDGHIQDGDDVFIADLSDAKTMSRIADTCLGETLKKGILIHAAFFLGPNSFYEALHAMTDEELQMINMTSVLNVNQLYGNQYASQELKTLQRKNARFANAALLCTLSGAVASDGLENNQVISGVGGQYNFVSMAHALPDARSILMLRATRSKGKEASSNIVWTYGYCTIPRHLRDIVITEYGIASLRGQSDSDVMKSLIHISDSRFQDELLHKAIQGGKISSGYKIPDRYRNNVPERLKDEAALFKSKGLFQPYPFGCDFTNEELVISRSLQTLKSKMSEGLGIASSLGKAMTIMSIPEKAKPYLRRLKLDNPFTAKEKMMQKMVIYALNSAGYI